MNKLKIFSLSRLRIITDGDGVSTLIGCMGCTLRCAYCINPYSWDKSISPRELSSDELYDEVKIDNLYFLATGGGLVFGGGEPLISYRFIKEFIEKYKSTGWKFTLETSLSAKKESLMELYNLIDYFIVDIKDMDKKRYELYTKGSYDLFFDNLEFLASHVEENKIKIRVPRIPNLHISDECDENYRILKDMGFKNIEIFDYVDPQYFRELSDSALENKREFFTLMEKSYDNNEI